VERVSEEPTPEEHGSVSAQHAATTERARAERLEAEVVSLREQLGSVLESSSWRLTRPLRRLRASHRPEAIRELAGDVAPLAQAEPGVAPSGDVVASRIDLVPRPGSEIPRRTSPDGFPTVFNRKVDLVAGSEGARSLRDFGGLYLVHGRYLLEPAVRLGATYAAEVDVTYREAFEPAIAAAKAQSPGLEVEFVPGDFRDPAIYEGLRPVDVSILFEVLLHQENYVDVIRNVLRTTTSRVCVAQPCLRDDVLPLPAGAVLVQFLDEQTKAELKRDAAWPSDEPVATTFRTDLWMWGQTTSHLIAVFQGFGWELEFGETFDGVCGPYWDYPLLRFRPSH
jgi:hypothetical protein